PRRLVNRFCGPSGVRNVPAHGLAPQNLSSDKHVDVCPDSDEDRGSTPLASSPIGKIARRNGCLTTELTTRPSSFYIVRQCRRAIPCARADDLFLMRLAILLRRISEQSVLRTSFYFLISSVIDLRCQSL